MWGFAFKGAEFRVPSRFPVFSKGSLWGSCNYFRVQRFRASGFMDQGLRV